MSIVPPRRLTIPAAIAGLGLALSACGGDSGADTSTPAEPEAGPLQAYFEEIFGEFSSEESMNESMMRSEEAVAACMAEQGFEYIPVDYSQQSFEVEPIEGEAQYGTLEYAEEYGYGITTQTQPQEVPQDSGEEFVDPNQAYVDAMSETEREAYYTALYGDQTMMEEGQEYNWEDAGCQGRASQETTAAGLDPEQMQALEQELTGMWESVQSDPRLTALDEEWATCMADAGHPGYSRLGDPEQSFSERVNAVYEESYANLTGELTEEEYTAIDEGVQERLAEMSADEVATAVADFECRTDVEYEKVSLSVSNEYEQEFVDSHQAELEAWAEAAKAARG